MMLFKKRKKKGRCNYEMHDGKPCGRTLYGSKHCIFHSKDIEGKKEKFDDEFWKEFERQKKHEEIFDFTGFVFPGDISFEQKEFEKKAIFVCAQFSGEALFRGAQFSGEANFENAKFSRGANFGAAQFSVAGFMEVKFFEEAYFSGAQFAEIAFFDDSQFHGLATFSVTNFLGVASFWSAQFSTEADFSTAKFKKEAMFNYIKIEKYNSFTMIDTYFYNVSGLFESIEANKKKFKYSNKTEFLPDNFYLILGEEATARYPIISRNIRDDMYLLSFKKKHPKMHFIWWLFADCGRSVLRWALWSLGLSLFFGLLWLILGGNFFYFNPEKNITWLSYFYYSFVTFTTLGFGDIVPTNWISETLVTIEVIFGYIMLGGLISILANKLARRS